MFCIKHALQLHTITYYTTNYTSMYKYVIRKWMCMQNKVQALLAPSRHKILGHNFANLIEKCLLKRNRGRNTPISKLINTSLNNYKEHKFLIFFLLNSIYNNTIF